MNDYIVLDGLRYRTIHKKWGPLTALSSTLRYTLTGAADVTYGAGNPKEWRGMIRVPKVAQAPWGNVEDLRATLMKKIALGFTDHDGNEHEVAVIGEIPEEALDPNWNIVHVTVRLVKV